ncbi:MAG: hypothetical protein A2W91_13355 [Bacteroidetes bacterium GWF2_38_335]|nr:MAG: hypothetical protein A2W91_13355 [Bacteroidetes bacterium GWF2_38_335]OFY77241.1 MAG: hypothetical protein A2281_15020 [Bacteroidetes bacterium RIFOXYA12_FULL_38_20]HBS85757.1 peptidase S41 [Bacteroidales bacterium]
MKKVILTAILFTFLVSCEKIFFEKDGYSEDPHAVFEYLWKECDEKYSFFDVKGVDWDEVHSRYEAKISDDMSQDQLFRVLGDMILELEDGHANLFSSFNISHFNINDLGQDNFDWRIVKDYYLPSDYYFTGPFYHDFINGTDNTIGYIRFPSFSSEVNNTNLDFIVGRYQHTKGIILDIRENGGGDPGDFFKILSRFTENKTLIYSTCQKSGPGHDEFTEPMDIYLEPSPNTKYLKKVIVLTDRGTYSAGSFMSLSTLAMPNVILMGDTTGGGLGAPNGGQLPNGWTYRFSVTRTYDISGNNYENGVPPDITVLFDWTDLTKDEIIERAIEEINR